MQERANSVDVRHCLPACALALFTRLDPWAFPIVLPRFLFPSHRRSSSPSALSLSLYSNLGEGNDMDTYATKLDAILRAKEEQLVALRAKLAAFQEQLAAEEQSRSQPRSGK